MAPGKTTVDTKRRRADLSLDEADLASKEAVNRKSTNRRRILDVGAAEVHHRILLAAK